MCICICICIHDDHDDNGAYLAKSSPPLLFCICKCICICIYDDHDDNGAYLAKSSPPLGCAKFRLISESPHVFSPPLYANKTMDKTKAPELPKTKGFLHMGQILQIEVNVECVKWGEGGCLLNKTCDF